MIITDDVAKGIAIGLLLAHLVVLLFLRRRIGWVIALNLIVSAGVVAYWLPDISELPGYVPLVWGFLAFEAAVLATSVAAAFGKSVPRFVIWTEFAAHAALTGGALYFMLTFKLTRLI